ncbi:hypothetical protein WJX84_005248 [Apatococcus fuscideae]|uniref:Uncharacterized protein n=1 Tax=Apatococcus fuscideae TaxID=2026836 RepID=A0AAW1SVD4_9CHLO
MTTGVTAALVSCGTVVVQNSLAGSAFGLQFRPAQQKSKGSSQPATAAAAAAGSLALEANLAEAALVTSKACSPPKTRGVTRSLAPAVSIAARKSKRRRGRPNGGSGDGGKGGPLLAQSHTGSGVRSGSSSPQPAMQIWAVSLRISQH